MTRVYSGEQHIITSTMSSLTPCDRLRYPSNKAMRFATESTSSCITVLQALSLFFFLNYVSSPWDCEVNLENVNQL